MDNSLPTERLHAPGGRDCNSCRYARLAEGSHLRLLKVEEREAATIAELRALREEIVRSRTQSSLGWQDMAEKLNELREMILHLAAKVGGR